MPDDLDPEAEAIIRDIQQSFLGVSRGSVTLHEAEVIDDYGTDLERREARKLDIDSRWEQVPDKDIEECTTALSYFDPESWRYYIAPYMIWSFRHFRTNDSIVSNHTIYTFDLWEKDRRACKYSLDRYHLLNNSQAQCVCRFLQYMSQNGDYADDRVARDALRKYWGKLCSDSGECTDE